MHRHRLTAVCFHVRAVSLQPSPMAGTGRGSTCCIRSAGPMARHWPTATRAPGNIGCIVTITPQSTIFNLEIRISKLFGLYWRMAGPKNRPAVTTVSAVTTSHMVA